MIKYIISTGKTQPDKFSTLWGSCRRAGVCVKIFDILTIAEVFSLIKEIEIQGCVTVPEEVSGDDFIDKFLAFIEENNWSFGGGYRTIIDGYYMNEDGTRGKHVLDA